ncbi:MAG: hypothetical protein JSW72_04240 [Candidatus Bathyarchaeota archaeon]|nr:MAG: hypothetical protein JSW72_04240 [Candidatus Bathyarchaeota archaeon]
MHTDIKNHRLGAFVYGFLSGLGLVLVFWGLASLIVLPSRSSTVYIGLILFGVLLFAAGTCREAYLRGSLSIQPTTTSRDYTPRAQPTSPKTLKQSHAELTVDEKTTQPSVLTSEQIREYPTGARNLEQDMQEQ